MPQRHRMFLMAVLACLMQFTWAVAAEQPYQASINFWAGEPSISTTCEKIPFEPFEDADYQSTDYAVGLLFREYDLDGDGRYDFMTARQIERISHQAIPESRDASPLFYWVDLDFNASYDQIWIDQGGQGRCGDIVLYEGPSPGRPSDKLLQNVMADSAY